MLKKSNWINVAALSTLFFQAMGYAHQHASIAYERASAGSQGQPFTSTDVVVFFISMSWLNCLSARAIAPSNVFITNIVYDFIIGKFAGSKQLF